MQKDVSHPYFEGFQLIVNHGEMDRCVTLLVQSNIIDAMIEQELNRIHSIVSYCMV
jgi:hypothetical protein